AILTNTPIYSDDYAMHYAQCRAVKKYISMFLSCWAYDPFYLAGMPNGTLGNADNKAWEVFYFLFSGVLGEGFAFKAYVVLFFLAYPVLLYAAARNFGLSRKIGLIAAGMGLLFFHLSLCISMVAWGMISYVFVCFFSIYVLSLWWRMLESFSITRCILFAVCLSIMVMMHILAVVHMGIPMAVMYLYRARHLPVRHQGMLIGSVIGGLAINSFWLWPVVDFFNDQTTRPENYEFTLQIKNVFEPLKVYIQQRRSTDHCMPVLNNTFFETLLLLFGVAGLYLWRKENRKALWHAFTAGICTIFLIAYYGSHTTLFPPLQPERYTIPLSLLLLVPASVAVARVLQAFVHRASLPTKFFIGALTFVLLYQPVVRPFGIFYKYKPYRLHTEMPEPITRLLDFLKYNTDREGRILIEDSEYTRARPDHQYFGGHYPAIFPEYVQREYLSGPRPLYPVKHSYASFTNGVLFERDITAYTDQELEEAFNLFNVRWIVAWNQKSKDVFSQNPRSISKLCDIDKFSVYTVNRQPSFFIKGSGKLRAEYNRIELTDVHPEDGEVIISYHWMKKLRAIPETTLEPVSLGGDPIGFIKIKNPPRAFVIVNTY
ncbi:MAG: hypothetical protein N3B18_06960, partial [Desulfobacterota bacterium]|nr:hypothetical protein [Thermodesulfobacteriota bacterium]